MDKNQDHISIFTKKYETSEWGKSNDPSKYTGSSGGGSRIPVNKVYTEFVRKFIDENNCKKIIDLGSGDWQSSFLIYENKDVQYYGYDAYDKVVQRNQEKYPQYTFIHLDILNNIDALEEEADLCILKDVVQHWTCDEITTFFDVLLKTKKYKYILLTNSCGQNFDNQDTPFRSRPLSIKFEPLKRYPFKCLFNYHNKEVSLLTL